MANEFMACGKITIYRIKNDKFCPKMLPVSVYIKFTWNVNVYVYLIVKQENTFKIRVKQTAVEKKCKRLSKEAPLVDKIIIILLESFSSRFKWENENFQTTAELFSHN